MLGKEGLIFPGLKKLTDKQLHKVLPEPEEPPERGTPYYIDWMEFDPQLCKWWTEKGYEPCTACRTSFSLGT